MDKEIIKYLAKNKYLKEKLEIIDNLIKEQDYKEAYFKLAAILEFINIKYIVLSGLTWLIKFIFLVFI